jgi:hypothetical protein
LNCPILYCSVIIIVCVWKILVSFWDNKMTKPCAASGAIGLRPDLTLRYPKSGGHFLYKGINERASRMDRLFQLTST